MADSFPDPAQGADPTMAAASESADTKIVERTTYQLFMVLVTLLALAIAAVYYLLPLPETVDQVLYILNSLVSVMFLYDFLARLYYAPNRWRYMFTLGWLDLLGALPGVPALRFLRVPNLVVTARELRHTASAEARMAARQRLAESTLLAVVLIVLVVVTVGSILIVLVEAPVATANIKTGDDAVWWSIVTVSTVGFGDRFPVTPLGRLIGTTMIVVGVSLFSVLTSYIATQFMARRKATGPSETELLRMAMTQEFEDLRRTMTAENAALREELVAQRRLLADQSNSKPLDRA